MTETKGEGGWIHLDDADHLFYGENGNDRLGALLAPAGDIDGDGLDDILIGSYNNSENGASAGKD